MIIEVTSELIRLHAHRIIGGTQTMPRVESLPMWLDLSPASVAFHLVVGVTITTCPAGCQRAEDPSIGHVVEASVLQAVDHARLDAPAAEFIRMTQEFKTKGRSINEFPELLSLLKEDWRHKDDEIMLYELMLPQTAESMKSIEESRGVPCWPMQDGLSK